ncbi:Protein piccolo [Labeo rohita]|uniref:Protein piccolo n=1 Tax=Labeo rohita TaxID=84645 RepID=A0ABQ8L2U2_LABRO|nr:Protein piccolo [Labeo rohita]
MPRQQRKPLPIDCLLPLPLLLLWLLPVWQPYKEGHAKQETDLASLDYDLYNKAHTRIYSRFRQVPLQNTSPPPDPAAFRTQNTMDPVSRLFYPRQGNLCIEDYVLDFCGLCHLVGFNDVALKDIFRVGLNDPIRSGLLGGKIHWSLEQYVDYALLLAGSSFTVGIADEGPRDLPVVTKPRPAHAMSAAPGPAHAMPAVPGPAHAMPAVPEPALVTSAKPQSAPVMAALPEPVHKMAAIPEPVHKMAAIPNPVHKMAAIPRPVHKMAAIHKPVLVMLMLFK